MNNNNKKRLMDDDENTNNKPSNKKLLLNSIIDDGKLYTDDDALELWKSNHFPTFNPYEFVIKNYQRVNKFRFCGLLKDTFGLMSLVHAAKWMKPFHYNYYKLDLEDELKRSIVTIKVQFGMVEWVNNNNHRSNYPINYEAYFEEIIGICEENGYLFMKNQYIGVFGDREFTSKYNDIIKKFINIYKNNYEKTIMNEMLGFEIIAEAEGRGLWQGRSWISAYPCRD